MNKKTVKKEYLNYLNRNSVLYEDSIVTILLRGCVILVSLVITPAVGYLLGKYLVVELGWNNYLITTLYFIVVVGIALVGIRFFEFIEDNYQWKERQKILTKEKELLEERLSQKLRLPNKSFEAKETFALDKRLRQVDLLLEAIDHLKEQEDS